MKQHVVSVIPSDCDGCSLCAPPEWDPTWMGCGAMNGGYCSQCCEHPAAQTDSIQTEPIVPKAKERKIKKSVNNTLMTASRLLQSAKDRHSDVTAKAVLSHLIGLIPKLFIDDCSVKSNHL